VVTEVSGKSLGSIFKGQTLWQEFFLDCLTFEVGTNDLSRNVGKQIPTYAV